MTNAKRLRQRKPAEKLRGLERRLSALEKSVGRVHDLVRRAESAVEQACTALESRQADESGYLHVRGIHVVNDAGDPVVSISALHSGGAIVIRNGAGEEIAAICSDENCAGVLGVKDPVGLAVAGLQICAGRGELLTMSNQGEICQISPGRPTQND